MPPEPIIEFFDRASMPPEIAELLDAWPEIDSGTARLVRESELQGGVSALAMASAGIITSILAIPVAAWLAQ